MALEKKYKKDKEILIEFEYQTKDVRQQLTEQLRCLDQRLDCHLSMLWELQDFYRRRAEVEGEYARSLDKLVKNILTRHKAEKQRDGWMGYSTYKCWQMLLTSTRRSSQDHAILAELFNSQMIMRFQDLMDDTQRMYKKVRDIGAGSHEELIKVLNELQSAMKTYHLYHGESKIAENKLRYIEGQKQKVEQHAGKGTLTRKFKNFEKQTEKRQNKYKDNKLKALKARNEYLLCLDAANAAVNKYYREDMSNMVDCMDCGFHNTLARAIMMHISAEENTIKSMQGCMDRLHSNVNDLDQGADKQNFLEMNHQAFMLPKKFDFQAHKGDEVCQISAQKQVQDELLERLRSLNERLKDLKLENDEVWKTLKTAETSLTNLINQKDYDVSSKFQDDNQPPKSPHEYIKKRSDRVETEAFYMTKFNDYLTKSSLITRLEAKHNSLQKALGESGNIGTLQRPPSLPPKSNHRTRKIGKVPNVGQPKLFGGSIEEYVETTGREIPLVVKSCIRVINLYGMHHQGVFRISGSHHEINDFKNLFEKGVDPLEDVGDGKDINSIAGVLKLYFRELREPLFPTQLFDAFIASTELGNSVASLARIKELVLSLPRPIFVVMRYLFAFLNHLTEYSDENMMESYNLAICFGPTLLRTPPDKDQVQYQVQVNDVVKNIMIHQEELFPNEGGGELYEKCIVGEDGERDDTTDNMSDDDDDGGDAASEEEQEVCEAFAQYDFKGRTDRELSFKKGDTLVVFQRKSDDWWEGALRGKEGLIPDKYIIIKKIITKEREDEDRGSMSDDEKRKSTESLPARPFGPSSSSSSSSSEDLLDKSASQPNIAIPPAPMSQSMVGNISAGPTLSNLSVTSSHTSSLSGTTVTSDNASTDGGETGDRGELKDDVGRGGQRGGGAGQKGGGAGQKGGGAGQKGGGEGRKASLQLESPSESRSTLPGHSRMHSDPNLEIKEMKPARKGEGHSGRGQGGMDRSTDDLNLDIDSALAEIMSGVQSLEMQTLDMPLDKLPKPSVTHPRHTPDLVLDLPVSTERGSRERNDPDSPTMSTAEVFAKSNQSTIKKGQSLSTGKHGGGFSRSDPIMPHRMGRSADQDVMTMSVGPMSVGSMSSFGSPSVQRSPSHRSATSVQVKSRMVATAPSRTVPERYSDPSSETTLPTVSSMMVKSTTLPAQPTIPHVMMKSTTGSASSAPPPDTAKSRTLPANTRTTPDRSLTPELFSTAAPDRPTTPDRPVLNAVPKPFVAELENVVGSSSSRGPTPERGEKPKPPIKVKPPLLRKPGKSPEVLRRLREHQEALGQTPNPPP